MRWQDYSNIGTRGLPACRTPADEVFRVFSLQVFFSKNPVMYLNTQLKQWLCQFCPYLIEWWLCEFEQLLCSLQTCLKCNMLESCTFPYGLGNEIALCVLNLCWHRQLCLLCVYTSENPSSPSFILSVLAQTHIWKKHSGVFQLVTKHLASSSYDIWGGQIWFPKAGKPRKSHAFKSLFIPGYLWFVMSCIYQQQWLMLW